MPTLVNQPTAMPTRKVTAGIMSIPLSTLIIWGAGMAGVPIPPEVAAAAAGLISSLLAYFVRERKL